MLMFEGKHAARLIVVRQDLFHFVLLLATLDKIAYRETISTVETATE